MVTLDSVNAPRSPEHGELEFRALTDIDQISALSELFDEIWSTGPETSHFGTALLIALRHGGHYVVGAYLDGLLVGGCVGFFVEPLGQVLHSHIAGVRPGYAGQGIGRAIKEHQRSWCLDRGVTSIQWTFDPLIARNAYFNLQRLGADPLRYKADFYGPMVDGINAGDSSDRMLVSWDLVHAASPRPATDLSQADTVLRVGADGAPEMLPVPEEASTVVLQIPSDMEALRIVRPAQARDWRRALRQSLEPLMLDPDWESSGFDSAGYSFTRVSPHPKA